MMWRQGCLEWNVLATGLLTVLALSCSRAMPVGIVGLVPIRFSISGAVCDTRGTGVMTTEKLDSFGVFAVYVPENNKSTDLSNAYMMNVPYARNASGDRYDTTPERWWPAVGNLTFFALAPYDTGILEKVDIEEMKNADYPTILWGPDSDPRRQVDICVAVNSNQPRQMEVPLEFHHATSQIYFAANYIELEDGEFIVIDSIILRNLIGAKKVTVTGDVPYVRWESDGILPRDTDYLLHYRKNDPSSTLDSLPLAMSGDCPQGVQLTNGQGTLFLVPQTYCADTENVEITVIYDLWLYDPYTCGPEPVKVRHTKMEGILPPCTWEPDTRYRYILTIDDETRDLDVSVVRDYISQPATFYAMTNVLDYVSASAAIGSNSFRLTAAVGPDALPSDRKEVLWTVENEGILSITRDGDSWPGSNTVTVHCLKEGTTRIFAKTRLANSDDEHIEAVCEFTVTPEGSALSSYGDPEPGW